MSDRPDHWLLKTEPDSYSWDDLVRDGGTVWDGVKNNAALKQLRSMKKGDLALVYHTGKERSAVGVARVTSDPYPDPAADEERLVVVDLAPDHPLPRPVSLSEIKSDPAFEGFDLVRLPRLSVMAVAPGFWKRIVKLARS